MRSAWLNTFTSFNILFFVKLGTMMLSFQDDKYSSKQDLYACSIHY